MLLSLAIALTSIPGVKNIVWAAEEDVDYVAEVEYGSGTIVKSNLKHFRKLLHLQEQLKMRRLIYLRMLQKS